MRIITDERIGEVWTVAGLLTDGVHISTAPWIGVLRLQSGETLLGDQISRDTQDHHTSILT